ncbi:MAG: hypothetical protein ACRDD8_12030 [Bacteroidales bacterium]
MSTNIKSKGTFGLSHFKSSRAAMEMYEPLYRNLFTVQLMLPTGVGSTNENTNLVLENVTKISGLESHRYPDAGAVQTYKWAQRRFIGAKPEATTMDISMDFEVNLQPVNGKPSAYVLRTLRKWCDLAYDPQTGRTGLKKDYAAPWMLITSYDRAQQPYWQWKCYNVFPMSPITPIELDYNGTELYKITDFKIAVDYFDESII